MAIDSLPTVLFLHPSDELYGADRQLLTLVRASRGLCRPLVLLPNDIEYEGRLSEVLREQGVDVERGPLPVLRRRYARPSALVPWLLRSARGWWWVMRVARSCGARVIVSNSAGIPVGSPVAALLRGSHLWFVREVIESPSWFRRFIHVAAHLSRGRVLAVSEAVATWIGPIAGHGPDTLHDGVDASDCPEPMPQESSAVFVGRINDWKGWEVFVEAAETVHKCLPHAKFRLVGGVTPGSEIDALMVEARIQKADPASRWLRWIGEQLNAIPAIQDAWLVAVPSTRPDPFPNVVLEAMREGRAVVGSDHGGIPEMVMDGSTGLLIPANDARALAAAMESILSDRSLAERLGAAGHERVRAEFSSERFESTWVSILAEIL